MLRIQRDGKKGEIREVAVTITTETFIRVALLTAATIFTALAIHRAAHSLLIIFIAFFLALALNGPVHWVSKKFPGKLRGNRVLATSLAYLMVVVLIGAFIASITPPLVRQTNSLIDSAPRLVSDFRSQDSETGRLIRKYNLEDRVSEFSSQLSDRLDNIGGTALSTLQSIGTSAFTLIIILVLAFMMLVEGPRWLDFLYRITPDKHHVMSDRLLLQMYKVVKGFVNGQVILAAIAAVLIVPVLLLLDIGYPAALMVVVFVCGLVPMVGHTIGAIIVTLVALFSSLPAALIILTYYIFYQQFENIFIQPRVQANTTNMSPLMVLIAVVIGISFGGIVGGLLAIPIAGCIRVLLLEYLRHRGIINDDYQAALLTPAKTK